jgi:hypothetical protein
LTEIYNYDLFIQQTFCGIVTNKHSEISHYKGCERKHNYLTLYFPTYYETWVTRVEYTNFVDVNVNDEYCVILPKGRITNPDTFLFLNALGFIYVALLILCITYYYFVILE